MNPSQLTYGRTLMQRFFGGPPLAVIIRLAVVSIIVGIILSALGLNPYNLLDSMQRLFWRIYDMGFEAVEWVARYLILGALVVLPIWFISRLWNSLSRSGRHSGRTRQADDLL